MYIRSFESESKKKNGKLGIFFGLKNWKKLKFTRNGEEWSGGAVTSGATVGRLDDVDAEIAGKQGPRQRHRHQMAKPQIQKRKLIETQLQIRKSRELFNWNQLQSKELNFLISSTSKSQLKS